MKDTKPSRDSDANPSRGRSERPDNGSRSSKGLGPSSGMYRDNPHKAIKLVRHAWLNA